MPKKRILQGDGPDGCAFDVVEDKNGFIIKCGLKKRTSIRLSSNMTAAEINKDTVCIRIGSYLALKVSAGTEISADNEHAELPTPSIGGDSRAVVISRKTAILLPNARAIGAVCLLTVFIRRTWLPCGD
jgi:hypothetical protein